MSNPEHSMDEEIRDLNRVMQSPAGEAQTQAGEHPTLEKLLTYHLRALSDEETARLQDHLMGCRECASQLLDFAAFCAPVEESNRISQAEIKTSWDALKARLGPFPGSSPAPQPSKPSLGQRLGELILLLFPHRYAYAMAGLLAVSLLLAVWVIIALNSKNRDLIARLNERPAAVEQGDAEARRAMSEEAEKLQEKQQQIDEARARADQLETRTAQLEAQVAEERRRNRELRPGNNQPPPPRVIGITRGLSLMGTRRAADDEPFSLDVPADGSIFTLIILPPPSAPNYPKYALEITDPNDNPMPGVNLLGSRRGELMVYLQRESFPAGQYHFKLYGIRRGVRTLVGERLVEFGNKKPG